MIVLALLSLGTAWLLGIAVTVTCWPRERASTRDLPLLLAIGALVGLGASSVVFFAASLCTDEPARWSAAVELAGTAMLAWWSRGRWALFFRAPALTGEPFRPLHAVLGTLLAQATAVSGVVTARAYSAEPYGGWDGWAIWNMHARFMARAGTGWPDVQLAPQISWTHPDYPRLVPASVARVWEWTGGESSFASALVSGAFAAALLALLVAGVARLRGWTAAFLGGLLLVGTPFFVTFASNQHADIPLAAYMLGAVVLLALRESSSGGGACALAGVMAGFAAWAKNEGLLFAAVAALGVMAGAWRHGQRGSLLWFGAGLAVALVPVGAFKFLLAPPNDLVVAPLGPRLAQLLDGPRHAQILAALWRDVRQFGEWRVLPYLAMLLPLLAWRARRRLVASERLAPVLLLAMLAGYYLVYATTPHDLAWHLETSLVRLLLQLWPLALFAWCLVLPDAPGSPNAARRGSGLAVLFVIMNVLGAVAIVGVFARQLGADELAAGRVAGAPVRVAIGEGWFNVERHNRERWAWSGGNAELLLHVEAAPSAPGTLRFGLRSLGSRNVTVRLGDRVLWRGHVGEELVMVELRTLALHEGRTTIAFMSDAPPVLEPAASARALAFAVSHVSVR